MTVPVRTPAAGTCRPVETGVRHTTLPLKREASVSYMLLIVEQPGERDVPPDEGRRRYTVMRDYASDLASEGKLVRAESLTLPTQDGLRVKRRNGGKTVMDGPFAEAKEIVGGVFLLTTESEDEALAIAEACPAAEWSIVEVRKLGPCWDGADPM